MNIDLINNDVDSMKTKRKRSLQHVKLNNKTELEIEQIISEQTIIKKDWNETNY